MIFALYEHCAHERWDEASLLLDKSTSEEAAELVNYLDVQGHSFVLALLGLS